MRLYLKLVPFVVGFILLQALTDAHRESIQQAIFAIRCGLAWTSGDDDQIERLVQEGQLQLRRDQDELTPQILLDQTANQSD